ncbi:STAS domain-containing protein [Pseudonocardia sp. CA-107938]|uniref:STAS domain-containing protein n=1 Tax=Pseudonocardia sp. CA-107938 TaxID=3240021 RepID=UPI003D908904
MHVPSDSPDRRVVTGLRARHERAAPGEAVLVVEGEVDLVTVPALTELLDQALANSRRVILDLGGVTFCGAVGVRALVRAAATARAAGAELRLRGASPILRRITALCDADSELSWVEQRRTGQVDAG